MNVEGATPLTRRAAVVAGLAALAAGSIRVRHAKARTMPMRGVAGGGLVQFTSRGTAMVAHCSVFATRLDVDEAPVFVGLFRWAEPRGITLRTEAITEYRPPADGRPAEIHGTVPVEGQGNQPFVLLVEDGGPPGSGLDTLALKVGAAAGGTDGFSYEATALLIVGDLTWLSFDVELDDAPAQGDPTAEPGY